MRGEWKTGMRRQLLNVLHYGKKWLWKLLRVKTRGVRVMLFNNGGELLLIRHTYGRSDLFLLPGGGIRPWEAPEQAARREVKEEVGCTVSDLASISTHYSEAEGKRDTVHLFRALSGDEPVADGVEVEEARYFPLDRLPATVSRATMRRIQEHLGMRKADGTW